MVETERKVINMERDMEKMIPGLRILLQREREIRRGLSEEVNKQPRAGILTPPLSQTIDRDRKPYFVR